MNKYSRFSILLDLRCSFYLGRKRPTLLLLVLLLLLFVQSSGRAAGRVTQASLLNLADVLESRTLRPDTAQYKNLRWLPLATDSSGAV